MMVFSSSAASYSADGMLKSLDKAGIRGKRGEQGRERRKKRYYPLGIVECALDLRKEKNLRLHLEALASIFSTTCSASSKRPSLWCDGLLEEGCRRHSRVLPWVINQRGLSGRASRSTIITTPSKAPRPAHQININKGGLGNGII